MKKILLALSLLLLVSGCNNTTVDDSENNVSVPSKDVAGEVKPVLSVYDLYDATPEELIEAVFEAGGVFDPAYLQLIGRSFPSVDFETYGGQKFNPSDLYGQKVLFQVAASWDTYCQDWTKNVMDQVRAEHPDLKFVQIFTFDDVAGVEEFYQGIGKDVPADVIPSTDDVMMLMSFELGVSSYPSYIFVNEEGVIEWVASGYLEAESFTNNVDLAYGENNASKLLGEEFLKDMNRTYKDVKEELYDSTVEKISELRPANLDQESYDIVAYSDLGKNVQLSNFVTVDGTTIEGADLANKKMIYTFLGASDDPMFFVESHNNLLKDFAEAHPDYEFVTFFLQASEQTVAEYLATKDDEFVGYLVDTTDYNCPEEIYRLTLYNIPTIYFVNTDGRVAGTVFGELTMDLLNKANDLYMGETPVYINK